MKIHLKTFYVFIITIKIFITIILAIKFPDSFIYPDSGSYITPAIYFGNTLSFVNELGPEVYRTPGYPLFLTPSFVLGIPLIYYASVLQLILVCLCAYYIYKITYQISQSKTASHTAAFLTLISPEIALSQHAILSEILFTFLLTYSIYLLLSWLKSENPLLLIIGFLLLTASAFVRPTSLYLPYLISTIIILYILLSFSVKKKSATIIIMVLMLSCHAYLIEIWKERNLVTTGSKVFASAEMVFMNEYLAASILAKGQNKNWEDVRMELSEKYDSLPPFQRKDFATTTLTESIYKFPIQSLKIFSKGFLTNAADAGFGDWINFFNLRKTNSGIIYKFNNLPLDDFIFYLISDEKILFFSVLFGIAYILLLWGFFVVGALSIGFTLAASILLSVIFYILIVSAGPQSLSRFRVPVMPFIFIFVSIGICEVLSKINKTKKKSR